MTGAAIASVVAVLAVGCGDDSSHRRAPAAAVAVPSASSTHSASPSPTRRVRTSGPTAAADALPGMPQIASSSNLYADAGAGMLSAAVKGDPYRIYVPNSGGASVGVIDPAAMQIVNHLSTRLNPQQVLPSLGKKGAFLSNDIPNTLKALQPP